MAVITSNEANGAVEQTQPKAKVAFITGNWHQFISKQRQCLIISGITGQDGSYLTEILLDEGYQVHGLVRPSSQRRQALDRPMRRGVTLHFGDVNDSPRLMQILGKIQPDEVYHLAAQSHVGVSFETPLATCETNAMGTLRLLEAIRLLGLGKTVRIYNVSTLRYVLN